MKKPINIRIEEKILEKIKSKAADEKRTVTNLVEYVMEQYCDGKSDPIGKINEDEIECDECGGIGYDWMYMGNEAGEVKVGCEKCEGKGTLKKSS